jgi:serine/threonine-protein kinase
VDVMTAGRVIGGRYHVEALLGRGGTASVWRARDTRLDRRVAVKELTGRWLEEPTALQRFDREARLVARLAHPNIVAVHDVDIHAETPYLVMELIEGVTVRQMLGNGVLTVGQAVAIATQTCDGLSAAHAAGVIHRDVKPANLMLTPAGVVRICDFGIAQRLSHNGETGPTGPQFVMGTTRYMAPEQVRGEHVDARADLYGLGCTLYAMLTGVPPFPGVGADVLRQHLDEEPVALREHRADVPPSLEALVSQLLAKAAADRPHDAAEVKARLADIMNHQATEATPSPDLAPSRGGPVPFLSGRVRGRAAAVAPARADGPTPPSRARARRIWLVGAAGVVALTAVVWALAALPATPHDVAVPDPAATAVLGGPTAGSGPSVPQAPTAATTPEVATGGAVQSNVDVTPTVPPPLDPVAVMRQAIQEQVSTGNLNPDRASDLYKQVDLIAKAVNGGNRDEIAKNIKAMRDKLTALRTGGQLSASGYDTLLHDLDAIAAPAV